MATQSFDRRATSMRSLVLGPSLAVLTMVGTPSVSLGQNASLEEACEAFLNLRSPAVIERVIVNYADHPCVPLLLASLPAENLSRISPQVVATLPHAQLRKIPRVVLEQLGISARYDEPRSVPTQRAPTNASQY
ncbi:hypothetical protein [Devosia nitrariae]|uniref:Uncharacterized protein n=1 Tax=Devosia nitrariae TaxID=2071872 RepID=A0ABQ5WDY2_9HYPH|nr:hypothetical protein [Devosia nitrariae]GLQ58001.1 hypothetical protein GCM10010862_52600 [Devosia nitrariae]